MNQSKQKALQVWGMSLLLGALAVACSAETGSSDPTSGDGTPTPAGYSVQNEQDGSVGVTKAPGAASPAPTEEEKAGCTHIRYCNNGNPVICDIDNHGCSWNAIINECISDADYVCGSDWSYMRIVD